MCRGAAVANGIPRHLTCANDDSDLVLKFIVSLKWAVQPWQQRLFCGLHYPLGADKKRGKAGITAVVANNYRSFPRRTEFTKFSGHNAIIFAGGFTKPPALCTNGLRHRVRTTHLAQARNPLRARLVRKAENWPWSSLGVERHAAAAEAAPPLATWPLPRHGNGWSTSIIRTTPPVSGPLAAGEFFQRCCSDRDIPAYCSSSSSSSSSSSEEAGEVSVDFVIDTLLGLPADEADELSLS